MRPVEEVERGQLTRLAEEDIGARVLECDADLALAAGRLRPAVPRALPAQADRAGAEEERVAFQSDLLPPALLPVR